MANLTPSSSWDNVFQVEINTPLLGGAGGPLNSQAQALLNRTQWLHDTLLANDTTLAAGIVGASLSSITPGGGILSVTGNVVQVGYAGYGTGGNFRAVNDAGVPNWLAGILGGAGETRYSIYDIPNGREIIGIDASNGLTSINYGLDVSSITPSGGAPLVVGDDATTRALVLKGSGSGSSGGATVVVQNGGGVNLAFGNKSAILGGAYDATPTVYGVGSIALNVSGTDRLIVDPSFLRARTGSSDAYFGDGPSLVSGAASGTAAIRSDNGDLIFTLAAAEKARVTNTGFGVTGSVIAQLPGTENTSPRGLRFGVTGSNTVYGGSEMNLDSGELRHTAGYAGYGGYHTWYANGNLKATLNDTGFYLSNIQTITANSASPALDVVNSGGGFSARFTGGAIYALSGMLTNNDIGLWSGDSSKKISFDGSGNIATTTGFAVTGSISATSASTTQAVFSGYSGTGGASSANGQIELGGAAANRGVLSYDSISSPVGTLYIDNNWDDSSASVRIRTRTSGTPQNVAVFQQSGLAVAGSISATNGANVGGFSPPASGVGLEMGYDGTQSVVQSYDRTGLAYKPLWLDGSLVQINTSSTPRLLVALSGNVLIGTTTDDGYKLDVNGPLRAGNSTVNNLSVFGIQEIAANSASPVLAVTQNGSGAGIDSTGSVIVRADNPQTWAPTTVGGAYNTFRKGGTSTALAYMGSDGGAAFGGGSGDSFGVRALLGDLLLASDVGAVKAMSSVAMQATPSSAWGIDFAASNTAPTCITLADNATYDLAQGSGLIILHSNTTGYGGVFYACAGTVAILSDTGAQFNTAINTAGRINIYYNGVNNYRIQNKTGGSVELFVAGLRTRTNT